MSLLLSAVVQYHDYNQGQTSINVTLDKPPVWRYESRQVADGTAYLARDGDVAHFLFHSPKNESGFGGRTFVLDMVDGTKVSIKGPWSSNCSGINLVFGLNDGEQLIECVDDRRCIVYVRMGALVEMGVDIVWRAFGGGDDQTRDGYWEARRKRK